MALEDLHIENKSLPFLLPFRTVFDAAYKIVLQAVNTSANIQIIGGCHVI